MILLIPILTYTLLTIGLVFMSNRTLKDSENRKKAKKSIITLSIILSPILGFLYVSFLFGISLENHYDVKKGTFLWYATMENNTITEFPVIQPTAQPEYHSIGGDSPSIGTGWEIQYKSEANREVLISELVNYLKAHGYPMKEVNKTQYYRRDRYIKTDSIQLFSGQSEKGESLDLIFRFRPDGMTEITCTVVY